MEHLKQQDQKVFQAIQEELGRQRSKIELIASEKFVIRFLPIQLLLLSTII